VVQIEPNLVGFLIVAPSAALGVVGIAIARYTGPNETVRSVRSAGKPGTILAVATMVVWLLLFRFLEI
jgi:hypothetical protein